VVASLRAAQDEIDRNDGCWPAKNLQSIDRQPTLWFMPVESRSAKAVRLNQIIAGLKKAYPDAHCELNFSSPLELLIATILSAQCTDKRVNLVTGTLFRKYPSAAAYAGAPLNELEEAIKSTGFFRNKAKSIKACCQAIVEKHGGEVPPSMEQLIELGGVGRKTANVVLGNAFNINSGVVVDTHVARLSCRLGLTRQIEPGKIEQELMELVPKAQWTLFSHWLIWHGRRRCFARNPDCPGCEVRAWCPRIGVAGPKTVDKEQPEQSAPQTPYQRISGKASRQALRAALARPSAHDKL
jgi:endonuclease-3